MTTDQALKTYGNWRFRICWNYRAPQRRFRFFGKSQTPNIEIWLWRGGPHLLIWRAASFKTPILEKSE